VIPALPETTQSTEQIEGETEELEMGEVVETADAQPEVEAHQIPDEQTNTQSNAMEQLMPGLDPHVQQMCLAWYWAGYHAGAASKAIK